ncbi:stalk domain-containing protein [Paenibacillus sp. N3.4]|uniref:stalk domain-containing protein n=1 Tax=Paenibacillus sp. N3.4 TaxID=2603222 RepID=UPI001C9CF329|nr:stalk domain-containing protein [Paenibacillus sp. N3.4]
MNPKFPAKRMLTWGRSKRYAMILISTCGMLLWTNFAVTGSTGGQALAAESNLGSSLRVVSQPIVIDGHSSEIQSANVSGSTYIGLRMLIEKLGFTLVWNEEERTATISGHNRTLKMSIDSGQYIVNDNRIYGSSTMLHEGSLFVPLRLIAEQMGYGVSYDAATQKITIDAIKENNLTIQTVKVAKEGSNQSSDIQYPQIAGLADKAVQQKINDFLVSENQARISAGLSAVKKADEENAKIKADNPTIIIPPSTLESSYEVTYNEQNKLSLYSDYYLYTGGAHGTTSRRGYTFDLLTGEQVTLKEAARNQANYVSQINTIIKKQISDTGLFLLAPFETIEADRDYFLKHEGIVVYFNQYEYTAYAEGMPEFIIPFSSLK